MPRRNDMDTEGDTIEPGHRHFQPQRVAVSPYGMVSSQHHEATRAGKEILAAGGNAVDAACATALALGVCEPAASGIGGQTMMIIHLAATGQTLALDGSSRAPNRALAEQVTGGGQRFRGHRATTAPSSLATYDYALKQYGTFPFAEVVQPAIRLATKGYTVSVLQNALAQRELKHLRLHSAGGLFLRDGRRAYPAGSRFRQPVLARTLRRLAAEGVEDFYLGGIARKIHRDMRAHDGLLHLDDLAQIPHPIERKPVSCRFEGHRFLTFPPPGAGRTLVEMLHILGEFSPGLREIDSPRRAVLLARVIRQAFLDRRDRPFDPAFYQQIDDRRMMSPRYAALIARTLRRQIRSHGETTHLSVMDRFGNAVGLTQSIERVYGSFCAAPDLGFLYNNYMSCFETGDISHPYYLRPNAVPWASVAPTIGFRGRRPWLVIGSPGSQRITPAIVQVLLRLQKQSPFDAVEAPRLHCSLEGRVSFESSRMRSDIPAALNRAGFELDPRAPYSFYLGCVQLVLRERDHFIGVADPRRDGSAAGPGSAPPQ
jgi:gamma-glutamyltranspeptidase/glutathione hydrolase